MATINSRSSVSSCTASAKPAELVDVLQVAPRLLQCMCPETKAALSSTSRHLRCLVYQHVSSISIDRNSQHIQCLVADLVRVLVKGSWPSLRCLHIRNWQKTAKNLELKATGPRLPFNGFGTGAMSQMVAGNWPALRELDLSNNKLGTAATSLLSNVDWPLEKLNLSDSKMDVNAIEHLLQGRWPTLTRLTLRRCKLNAQTVAVLGKAQWPLKQLDLGHNSLDVQAVAHLARGNWPDLERLVLAGNPLTAEAVTQLCHADWPLLVSLDISCCPFYFYTDLREITNLCKAHWPGLSNLDLHGVGCSATQKRYLGRYITTYIDTYI